MDIDLQSLYWLQDQSRSIYNNYLCYLGCEIEASVQKNQLMELFCHYLASFIMFFICLGRSQRYLHRDIFVSWKVTCLYNMWYWITKFGVFWLVSQMYWSFKILYYHHYILLLLFIHSTSMVIKCIENKGWNTTGLYLLHTKKEVNADFCSRMRKANKIASFW